MKSSYIESADKIGFTTTVEFQRGLKGDSILGGFSLAISLFCRIKTIDIGLMMLRVVQFHYFF